MSSVSTDSIQRLGIIAGRGRLPHLLRESAEAKDIPLFILGFKDVTDDSLMEDVGHAWISLGDIAQTLQTLRDNGVSHLVMGGGIPRPTMRSIKPSTTATKFLAKLGGAFFRGDDSLLSSAIKIIEDEGFTVLGVDDVLAHLMAPQGPIGRLLPHKRSQEDISRGVEVAHGIGRLDIGQSVIIKRGIVLGVEAAEGTEELIKRCANYGDTEERGGVLVKAKKPNQERRADLPTIGPDTIQQVADAGFEGIAVEAGSTLVLDRAKLVRLADDLGVFVIGFSSQDDA